MAFLPETKADGKRRMQQSWDHIQRALTAVLTRDPNVRPDAFAGDLTPEQFAQVLFSLLLSALLRQDYDPTAALALARTVLY